MDFGVPGSDATSQTQPKLVGSGFPKQDRSCASTEDHWKCSKLQRTDGLLTPKTMPLHQGTPLLRSNSLVSADSGGQQEHMLSFSSLKSEAPFSNKNGDFSEISALNSAKLRLLNVVCFQVMVVEALMQACMRLLEDHNSISVDRVANISIDLQIHHCNVAVPSNLIIPLKKTLYPYGFTSSSAGSLPPNSLGWGSFHLGYSGSADPEPGRCRRTDGKKWWCSRDAVADQKYCERHITGAAIVQESLWKARLAMPPLGPLIQSSSGLRTCNLVLPIILRNTIVNRPHCFLITLVTLTTPSGAFFLHLLRSIDTTLQDTGSTSVVCDVFHRQHEINNSTFTITKQGAPSAESSQSDFGHVAFDSLVNLTHGSLNMDSKEYGHLLDFTTDQETQDQNLHHRFIDDWPKDVITWPGELRSDWTKLSMSNPMTSSEFSSSSSSPAREACPFASYASNVGSCKNSSQLSFISEGWSGSPHSRSPLLTGMFQTTPFGSLSNSSSGSSPISENKKLHDGSSLCDDVLGSTLVSSALILSIIRS
ncbi:hypothetical protein F3Y22_tig00110013pilonHSYRG00466 [Hibiscus syriacus]|uniref:Growth-regulating factor n=1 Tax=Hibiscus syriacus TaxID=106335 RepID=A0A6A3BPJ9_HIBSY|nr:hypothetical protein F3Y22_tig00110013pilonHSYRG00466 [Hibiscus syriacus]